MSEELQKLHEAVNELRKEVETKGGGNAEKIDKINSFLDKQEEKNQKLIADLGLEQKAREEVLERVKDLEIQLTKANKNAPDNIEVQKRFRLNALQKALCDGLDKITPEEFKAVVETSEASKQFAAAMGVKLLTTQSNVDGGFLIIPEFSQEIIKNITEISPMRSVVRVRSTRSKYFEQPRRENLVTGGWVGEARLASASNSKYELEQIPMRKCVVFTPVTHEELTQSTYNIEGEILSDMRERFAQLEGEAIVKGDGNLQPNGFMTDTRVGTRNTEIANSVSADSIILITGDIKTGYNPSYVMNRRTLAYVRTLKDGQGMYLWQPAFMDGTPSTLNGYRYINAIDMPDIGAGTSPIAFGDWGQGYTLIDGVDLAIIRDVYTQATEGIVRFVWHRFLGGQVVKPEAIKKLVCAVTP